MLRLAFDFIITWRETRTRPNAYRYMIPQEAAMSKTGQIHNNSNSVIHIGC